MTHLDFKPLSSKSASRCNVVSCNWSCFAFTSVLVRVLFIVFSFCRQPPVECGFRTRWNGLTENNSVSLRVPPNLIKMLESHNFGFSTVLPGYSIRIHTGSQIHGCFSERKPCYIFSDTY